MSDDHRPGQLTMSAPDDELAVYPTKVCPRCAGTGIDHSATPREVQMLWLSAWWVAKEVGHTSKGPILRERVVRLAVFRYHQEDHQGAGLGPLAYVIARLEVYVAAGYELVDGREIPSHNLKCRRCHGWGDVEPTPATKAVILALEAAP